MLIDIPTGKGVKVETVDQARALARDFIELGKRLGQYVEVAVTYGGQPIGHTVGPALEAREALSTLMTGKGPGSLIEKATGLAGGILLEMGGEPHHREWARRWPGRSSKVERPGRR